MTVKRVEVGDVVQLERRPVAVDPSAEYREIGLRSFGRGVFHKEPVSGAELGNKRVFEIHPGDLLFSNVFAWEGAVALADAEDAGRIGSHRFMTYVARDASTDLAYLRYFFLSDQGIALLNLASPGSAGRNKTLAIERFEALEIPLPDPDDQRRIVNRLDSVLANAAVLEQQVEFTGRRAVLEQLPNAVDSVLAQQESTTRSVDDLCEIVHDVVHPGDPTREASTFVGLQHVESHSGRRVGSDALGDEKGRKFRFRPGDVVYGYLRPYLNKVWIADSHGLCSVDQYVLRSRDSVAPELLAYCLRSRSALQQAIELTHNLQLPRLRSGLLLGVNVTWPLDAELALEKLRVVSDLYIRIGAEREAQAKIVRSLRQSILNHAFAHLR